MTRIKLESGVWELDEGRPLGPDGGFGAVFAGRGDAGDVAIKRLHLTAAAAAHREMNIGRSLAQRTLSNVVPILDQGQDADSDRYYLVMPVCEQSLEQYLTKNGPLPWSAFKPIALDIISGLLEVDDIVHRDLKPGNVLLSEGSWQIADFGIAKFVEDSTSLETLRRALTPSYGAPEQWLGERPTSATDVYALGCILHRALNGVPPFTGDRDTVRDAHLHRQQPALTGVPERLEAIVLHMLRKTAASRPSLARIKTVLSTIDDEPSRPAYAALAAAGKMVAQQESEADARRREQDARIAERRALSSEAIKDLDRQFNSLFASIENSAESVRRNGTSITLGPAKLSYLPPQAIGLPLSARQESKSGWDVAAHTSLSIIAQLSQRSPYGQASYTLSVTLVYCTTGDDPEFRWREISFWSWRGDKNNEPYAIAPSDQDFSIATSNVIGGTNVAHGPWPIDAEDEQAFSDRWLSLFARAASGELQRPMSMPPPAAFWK
jgi:eukaryotic-like serine/threonine-protein kinase